MAKNEEELLKEYKKLMEEVETAQKEVARLHKRVLKAADEHRMKKVVRKLNSIEE